MPRKWSFSVEMRYFIFVLIPLHSPQEILLTLHWCWLYFTQSVEQHCESKSSLVVSIVINYFLTRRLVFEFMSKHHTTLNCNLKKMGKTWRQSNSAWNFFNHCSKMKRYNLNSIKNSRKPKFKNLRKLKSSPQKVFRTGLFDK